jgi:hypothetical protein
MNEMMQATGSTSAGALELANTLQRAVGALQAVVDSEPETDRLLAEMVRICAEALVAGGAGVWVTETPDKPELVLEHNLAALQIRVEGVPVKGVVAGVRRCVREGKPLVVPPLFSGQRRDDVAGETPENPCALELLFVPLRLHGKVQMVLLLAVPAAGEGDRSLVRTRLNFLARQAGMVEQALTQRHLTLMESDRGRSGKLVRFAQQVHKAVWIRSVAADVANLARDVLEAARVTVEVYPGLKKRVVAVSNVDEPNRRGTIMRVQRLIGDYVRERQVPVVLDREAARQLVSDPRLQDAATAYFLASGFEAFMAAPIKEDDPGAPVLGVILAEYASTSKAQAYRALLGEVARLATGAVGKAIELESVPLFKVLYAWRKLWKAPLSSRRAAVMTGAVLLVGVAFVLGIMPVDFAVKADCQIRPRAQLPLTAPVQGLIVRVPVRAGEHVYPEAMKGQLGEKVKPLVVFDALELRSQKAAAEGKLGSLRIELQSAQQNAKQRDDYAKISALTREMDSAAMEIARLEHQIALCTVWSPIEGIVLTENVEQKQYSTPRQGEELLEVASFADWELVVDVPESDVAMVRQALEAGAEAGVAVEYLLNPWPGERYAIHAVGVATLLPASQPSQNRNVFRLRVPLDARSLPAGLSMSGVTGRAKIHLGKKPLLAQWTRGAWRMLKMTVLF